MQKFEEILYIYILKFIYMNNIKRNYNEYNHNHILIYQYISKYFFRFFRISIESIRIRILFYKKIDILKNLYLIYHILDLVYIYISYISYYHKIRYFLISFIKD